MIVAWNHCLKLSALNRHIEFHRIIFKCIDVIKKFRECSDLIK